MPHRLLQPIRLMKGAISSRLFTSQRRYKCGFDKIVRRERTYQVGAYKLINRPQLAAVISNVADRVANRRNNKLLRQASGPYRVLRVQRHTVTIADDSTTKTVSMDGPMLSLPRQQVTDKAYETTHIWRPQNESQERQRAVKDAKEATKDDITVAQEYVKSPIASCGHSRGKNLCGKTV